MHLRFRVFITLLYALLGSIHAIPCWARGLFLSDAQYLAYYLREKFFLDLHTNPIFQARMVNQFAWGFCRLMGKHFSGTTGECISVEDKSILGPSPFTAEGYANVLKRAHPGIFSRKNSLSSKTGLKYAKILSKSPRILNEDVSYLIMQIMTGEIRNDLFPELYMQEMAKWICRLSVMAFDETIGECVPLATLEAQTKAENYPSPLASTTLAQLVGDADPDTIAAAINDDVQGIHLTIHYDPEARVAYFPTANLTAVLGNRRR